MALSDEQIRELWENYSPTQGIASFARSVEAEVRKDCEASKDTERLDLLERFWSPNPLFGYGNIGGNLDLPTVGGVPSESLRDAIDYTKALYGSSDV